VNTIRTSIAAESKPCLYAAILAALSLPPAAVAQSVPGASQQSITALGGGEWPAYAGTYAAARYSPLTQIDRTNAVAGGKQHILFPVGGGPVMEELIAIALP
jgi:glucose dehydrogenase